MRREKALYATTRDLRHNVDEVPLMICVNSYMAMAM